MELSADENRQLRVSREGRANGWTWKLPDEWHEQGSGRHIGSDPLPCSLDPRREGRASDSVLSGRTILPAYADHRITHKRIRNGKHLSAVLLVDQSGTKTSFGDARSYAESIRQALQELAFPANVVVAPNAEVRLLLARSYTGVTRVSLENARAKLAPLPLSMLRIEAVPLATLTRWLCCNNSVGRSKRLVVQSSSDREDIE